MPLRDDCEIYVRLNAVDDMISILQWTLHMSFYGIMQVGISRSHFAANDCVKYKLHYCYDWPHFLSCKIATIVCRGF